MEQDQGQLNPLRTKLFDLRTLAYAVSETATLATDGVCLFFNTGRRADLAVAVAVAVAEVAVSDMVLSLDHALTKLQHHGLRADYETARKRNLKLRKSFQC